MEIEVLESIFMGDMCKFFDDFGDGIVLIVNCV